MPLFHYRPLNLPCRICGSGFELVQAAGDAPLTLCPTCGKAVTRGDPPTVHSPRLTRPASTSEAKDAGFNVFRKTSDGSYERQ